MIPSSNLFKLASQAIKLQDVLYFRNTGNVTNEIGMLVPQFATGYYIKGSVQAVPRSKYEYMGLDLQKNYVTLYTANNVTDLQRNKEGDQFIYCGKRFQCVSENDWFAQDGWTGILSVEIASAG